MSKRRKMRRRTLKMTKYPRSSVASPTRRRRIRKLKEQNLLQRSSKREERPLRSHLEEEPILPLGSGQNHLPLRTLKSDTNT